MLQTNKKTDIIFHFNKAHLSNPKIPMWVIKVKGKTYYVNHVDFHQISFSTKETPDNMHTKGSLKFKGYLYIDDNNNALVTDNKEKLC